MKQNDLIISIVAIVLALIIAGVCWGTKREPATIAPPEATNLGQLEAPAAKPIWANSLPGAGSSGGAGGGFGGGAGVAGAPAGMAGKGKGAGLTGFSSQGGK